jgi:hypothetical protein
MNPVGLATKNDCAGEGQQQFTQPFWDWGGTQRARLSHKTLFFQNKGSRLKKCGKIRLRARTTSNWSHFTLLFYNHCKYLMLEII